MKLLLVQYTHDTATDGDDVIMNGLRLSAVTYPNGRKIHYTYGTTNLTDDRVGRVNLNKEDASGPPGADLAGYAYNGSGRHIQTTYPGPKVRSSDDWDNDGIYTLLDRFGRRINLWWRGSGTNTRRYDETLYTYDYAGNRTSRDIRIRNLQGNQNLTDVNVAADLRDQDYEYDGLQRLKNVDQGKADLTTH